MKVISEMTMVGYFITAVGDSNQLQGTGLCFTKRSQLVLSLRIRSNVDF